MLKKRGPKGKAPDLLNALRVMAVHDVMLRELHGTPNIKGRYSEQRAVDNYVVSAHGSGKRFRMLVDTTRHLKESKTWLYIIRVE